MDSREAVAKKEWHSWIATILPNALVENLCLGLSISCGVTSSSVSKYMIVIDNYDQGQLLRVIVLMGIAGWMMAMLGTVLMFNCMMAPWKAYRLRYLFYSYFGWGLAIAVTFLLSAIFIFANHDFEKEFAPGFNMANYSRDLTVRSAIDTIQTEFGCCGNRNHTEWFLVPVIGHVSSSLVVIPDSCCNSTIFCIKATPPEFKRRLTPHKKGCLEAISSDYATILLVRAGLMTAIAVCEIFVLAMMREQARKIGLQAKTTGERQKLNGASEPKASGGFHGTAELPKRGPDLSIVSKEPKLKNSELLGSRKTGISKSERDFSMTRRTSSTYRDGALVRQGSKLEASAVSSAATSLRTSNSVWSPGAKYGVNESANSGAKYGVNESANSEAKYGVNASANSLVKSRMKPEMNSWITSRTATSASTSSKEKFLSASPQGPAITNYGTNYVATR